MKNEVSVWSIEAKGHGGRSPNSAQSTLIRATNQILPGCPRPLVIRGRGVHTHSQFCLVFSYFTVISLIFITLFSSSTSSNYFFFLSPLMSHLSVPQLLCPALMTSDTERQTVCETERENVCERHRKREDETDRETKRDTECVLTI